MAFGHLPDSVRLRPPAKTLPNPAATQEECSAAGDTAGRCSTFITGLISDAGIFGHESGIISLCPTELDIKEPVGK